MRRVGGLVSPRGQTRWSIPASRPSPHEPRRRVPLAWRKEHLCRGGSTYTWIGVDYALAGTTAVMTLPQALHFLNAWRTSPTIVGRRHGKKQEGPRTSRLTRALASGPFARRCKRRWSAAKKHHLGVVWCAASVPGRGGSSPSLRTTRGALSPSSDGPTSSPVACHFRALPSPQTRPLVEAAQFCRKTAHR